MSFGAGFGAHHCTPCLETGPLICPSLPWLVWLLSVLKQLLGLPESPCQAPAPPPWPWHSSPVPTSSPIEPAHFHSCHQEFPWQCLGKSCSSWHPQQSLGGRRGHPAPAPLQHLLPTSPIPVAKAPPGGCGGGSRWSWGFPRTHRMTCTLMGRHALLGTGDVCSLRTKRVTEPCPIPWALRSAAWLGSQDASRGDMECKSRAVATAAVTGSGCHRGVSPLAPGMRGSLGRIRPSCPRSCSCPETGWLKILLLLSTSD